MYFGQKGYWELKTVIFNVKSSAEKHQLDLPRQKPVMILSKLMSTKLFYRRKQKLIFESVYAGLFPKWPACLRAQQRPQPWRSIKLKKLNIQNYS